MPLRAFQVADAVAGDVPITPHVAALRTARSAGNPLFLAELVAEYHPRGLRLDEVAGGFVFRTSPVFAPFVREQVAKKPVKMSRAQIETLAIVAYRQPVTRPEVDEVRGVDSGAVLKSLLEREMVRIIGKKDEPGRPMLYGTTQTFLQVFSLKSLRDLPTLRDVGVVEVGAVDVTEQHPALRSDTGERWCEVRDGVAEPSAVAEVAAQRRNDRSGAGGLAVQLGLLREEAAHMLGLDSRDVDGTASEALRQQPPGDA